MKNSSFQLMAKIKYKNGAKFNYLTSDARKIMEARFAMVTNYPNGTEIVEPIPVKACQP